MDFVYMQYLHQIGVNPADYIQIQANYLRYLADSYQVVHKKSKSCSGSNNFFENYSAVPTRSTNDSGKLNTVKKMRYEDIPIKPAVNCDRLVSDELLKNTEQTEKSPEKTAKFEYLKRNPQNLALSSSKKCIRQNLREKPGIVKAPRSKSQSANQLKNKKSPQFLKKGQGRLCSRSELLSKSLSSSQSPKKSISQSPENSMKFTKSSQKLSQNLSNFKKPSISSKKLPNFEATTHKKSIEDQRYLKMLKDVENKSKKFEKDAEDFYKVRDKELNSLANLKKEVKAQVYDEKLTLQNEIINLRTSETQSLASELNELKVKISKQEEGFSVIFKELQEKIGSLQKENESLLDKFKAVQFGGLKPPSVANKSRRSSEALESETKPRSRNMSRDFGIPKLPLDKIAGKAQECIKPNAGDVKNSPDKSRPYLQRAYFSLKK